MDADTAREKELRQAVREMLAAVQKAHQATGLAAAAREKIVELGMPQAGRTMEAVSDE